MKFASIIQEQVQKGWLVDKMRIHGLVLQLSEAMEELSSKLEPTLPKCPMNKGELRVVTPPKIQFKKDGTPSAKCLEWFHDVESTEFGYIGVKLGSNWTLPTEGVFDDEGELLHRVPLQTRRPMLLKDNAHIKDYLQTLGWKPTWYNENKDGEQTSPKTKHNGQLCPNLERLDHPIAKNITHYMSMRHRYALLNGLLKFIRPDGRIPSEMDTVGTATFRVAHRKIANFPNTDSFFGTEIRSCFICPDDKILVSTDSDSCQMRMLAHYLILVGASIDDPYIHAILYGTKEDDSDAHCIARDLGGLGSRSEGKTLNYSILFGQGDMSTGERLGLSLRQTKAMKKTFFNNLPALPKLIRELQMRWEANGYLTGLDGRPIQCDSEHKLLNYALQSGEAIYMKVVTCFIDKEIKRRGLDATQVCFYHDELTHECSKADADKVAKIHEWAMVKAGEWLNVLVPMTGKAAQGSSWAQIH